MIETLAPEQYGWRNLNNGVLEPFQSPENGFMPGWGLPSWEDHFDKPLDTSVWNVRNGYQEAQDVSTMLRENVVVEDSCVKLVAKKQTISGRDYTSGYIDTIGRWSRRYGRFEIRAKLPTLPNSSRGLWPGLWLRDDTGGGELDIIEAIGSPNEHPEFYPASPGRYSSSLYKQTGLKGTGNPYWSQVFQNIDVADNQFHDWAVEWTPTAFTFLCDGIVQYKTSAAEYATFAPGFPSKVNFRIDLFIGSSWQGWPNDTDTILPKSLDIDYIRYWELPS